MITGKFKDAEYRNGIRALSKAMGKPMAEIVKTEARLFFKELIRVIPPKTQAQGKRAILKDLAKIFVMREPGYLNFVSKAFGKNQVRQELKTKKGVTYLIEFDRISFNHSELEAHHRKNRLKNGRVTNAGQKDRNIGRWKSRDAIWTTPKVFNRYRLLVQRRVGFLKAQFAFPLSNLGGKVPKWLRKHFRKMGGQFRNHLRKPGNPHVKARIQIFNSNKFKSAIDFTMTRRIKTMGRKAERELAEAWRRGR